MMVTIDLKDLTRELAERIALGLINEMIDFANDIQKVNPEAVYIYPLMQIEEMRERLRSDKAPLRSENQVDVYFNKLTQITINHRPSVKRQLQRFYDAHIEMANISHEKNIFYNPHKFIEANRRNIERVAEMEAKVMEQYENNPNNEMTIYALMFTHIQNTETVAKSMINQLRDTLKIGGLLSKYNPGEIFAVDESFSVKSKKKEICIIMVVSMLGYSCCYSLGPMIF